jgi:hypothetical protein
MKKLLPIAAALALLCIGAGETPLANKKLINLYNYAPTEIWISPTRSDGLGQGTEVDPYDGHNQAAFDALLANNTKCPTYTHIHLLPGTFQVSPHNEVSPTNLKSGWWIHGSGAGKTTVQIVGSLSGLVHNAAFTSASNGVTDNVTISDLTIDCNWPNIGASADTAGTASRSPAPNPVSDGVTNGTATVTSATLALTAADLHQVIVSSGTGATDIPVNTFIGIINSSTSLGLSSSPTSNIPINATGSHSGVTLTIKEKNTKVGAIAIYGTNNTVERYRVTNGYGSNANSQEQFDVLLGASTVTDSINNNIRFGVIDTPWGNYGAPMATFGNSPKTISFNVNDNWVYGVNNGLLTGFTTGGVNMATVKNGKLFNNHWYDCKAAHIDTSTVDGLTVFNDTVVRGVGGVTLESSSSQGNVDIRACHFAVQNRSGSTNANVDCFTSTCNNVVISGNTFTVDSGGLGGGTIVPIFAGANLSNSTISLNTIDAGNTSNVSIGATIFGNKTPAGATAAGLTTNTTL